MVDVGRDKPTHVGEPVALNASVRDDGLPTPTTTVSWSTVSGPGTVSFSAPERPPDIGGLQRQRDLRAPGDGKRHGPYRIR